MLKIQGADQKEFTGHNKGRRPLLREEFEIQMRPDITRRHTARHDRTDVEFSYIHQPLLSLCICDSKQAKVFSVLLITGADIHIRPGITQCQQREIQNAQNASVHWWPLRLQKTVRVLSHFIFPNSRFRDSLFWTDVSCGTFSASFIKLSIIDNATIYVGRTEGM